MSRVPSAPRRLWRNRPRLVALALLGAVAVAASVMQSTAALVLQQTLDENWRGTYDILVTQRDKDPVKAGLLNSESLVDATTGRLGMDDLATIRTLPGVEVAAPIGEVTFAESDLLGSPLLWLPVPVRADASLENPQAFRITLSSTTDDGTGPRDLATQTLLAFAYQPSYSQVVFDSTGAPLVDAQGNKVYATTALADSPLLLSADSREHFSGGAFDAATGTIPLGLIVAPRPAATIALVDPVAERQLLGDAGAFLDPLIDYTPAAGSSAMPIVVEKRTDPVVTVHVKVEEYNHVTPGAAGAEAVAQAQGDGFLQNGQIAPTIDKAATTTVVGDYSKDVSSEVSPYSNDLVLLGGISRALVDGAREMNPAPAGVAPRSIVHGRYDVPDEAKDTDKGIVLNPSGYAAYGQFADAPLSAGAPAGSVTQYSKLFGAVGQGGTTHPEGPPGQFDIVGEFSPAQIKATAGETSFMPLGGYDINSPSVVADPTGAAIPAKPLATSITGFGVPGTNNVAVGSFDILDGWGVDRPISAIRIRVAGITAYTPDAQQRLLAAVTGLRQLGFNATLVAGSSPQSLPVLVAGFATTEKDGLGKQVIADLGYIDQDWSRLGAVLEVESGVSVTSIALLAFSIVSVGVLLSVVQLGSIPARRAQANVYRQLGWRRGRIRLWFASEELIALLGVAIVGAVAIWFSSVRPIATVAVGLSLALVLVTSVIAVVAGARAKRQTARRTRPRAASRAPGVTGPIGFGARQARANLVHSVSLGLAVLFITVSIAIGVTVFIQGRELAGPSLLGAVASARAWLPQGVLAAASLAAGIALAVLSRRMSEERRRDQWAAIRAMGWDGPAIIRGHVSELAFSAVPGLLVGLALAVGITAAQAPAALPAVVVVSGLGGLVAVIVVLFSGRRLD